MADFTFYGGLYRNVNIIAVSESHFDLDYYGTPGIKVTPIMEEADAKTEVEVFLTNAKEGQIIRYTLMNKEGKVLGTKDTTDKKIIFRIKNAHLWHGRKDPYLYSVKAELIEGEEVLDTGSRAELERVQQEIITIQEVVLVLHKDQQQGMISNEDYDLKVAAYSQQMDELQERQRELKATAGRYAEVKYWLDAYREHIQSGEKMDTDDAVMIRSLTDKIVVYDDRLEIHLRIGEIIERPYK
jgi:hypothetical protein